MAELQQHSEQRFDNLFSVSVDWGALKEILASIDKELQAKADKASISSAMQKIMNVGDESGRLRREVMGRIEKVDVTVGECERGVTAAVSRVESLEASLKAFTLFDTRLQHLEYSLAGFPVASADNPPLKEVQDKARRLTGVHDIIGAKLAPMVLRETEVSEHLEALQEQLAQTALELAQRAHADKARPTSAGPAVRPTAVPPP